MPKNSISVFYTFSHLWWRVRGEGATRNRKNGHICSKNARFSEKSYPKSKRMGVGARPPPFCQITYKTLHIFRCRRIARTMCWDIVCSATMMLESARVGRVDSSVFIPVDDSKIKITLPRRQQCTHAIRCILRTAKVGSKYVIYFFVDRGRIAEHNLHVEISILVDDPDH